MLGSTTEVPNDSVIVCLGAGYVLGIAGGITTEIPNEPRQVISNKCGILTSVDSEELVRPPFKLRNSKCCSVSSLTVLEYSSD